MAETDDRIPTTDLDAAADTAADSMPDALAEDAVAAAPEDAAPVETVPAVDAPVDAVAEAPDAALVEAVSGGLTWIPFAVYLGLWVVLAGLSAYLLYDATPDSPARWMPVYEPLLWSGVGLSVLGPFLSLAVWLVARARRPRSQRRGLFASAMSRGSLVAFFGVVLWLGTLFVLELLASGWAL